MDHQRSVSGNGEDIGGIPDDLRCKRSDGKQWRCTAMSMPDKTVCEKHYIQAKKRAANSAMRASLKKAKRKSMGETDVYLESKSDDFDTPLVGLGEKSEDFPVNTVSSSGKKRSFSLRNPPKVVDSSQLDSMQFEDSVNWRSSYRASPVSGVDGSGNRSHMSLDTNNPLTLSEEYSDQSTESCEGTESGGQICHQCRRNEREEVFWCLKCDRRGYCNSCISSWYPGISAQEIQRICPACRGTCNCKVCLRGDNLLKVRIKEIPALDKLLYLHCLLSSVLPIAKQIHHNQCYEVELEKRLRGTEIDLTRTRLNADEQMCCNFCRIPIIDYHRHCAHCSYDLCISCSKDLREASMNTGREIDENETTVEQPRVLGFKFNFSDKFPEWKANGDGSIPCPPKEYGGCGYSSLNLSRIFKMNWVAKLVKNVEEMVRGCSIYDDHSSLENIDLKMHQYTQEIGNERFLYCPASEDLKTGGIGDFRKHWARGEPIIVKKVFDSSSVSSMNPMEIWKGIQETTNEKSKDENVIVKAIDCFDWSEVDVDLREFMKGYFEGRFNESGKPELMKLKNWPSPSASEEFLLYQRPEFISKLPLLEYIHSKWGLLNVAAKLPHYSLQNDVGPKIFISYGTQEELALGNSVTKLHPNMRDMVYLLVHSCEPKLYGQERVEATKESKTEESEREKLSPLDGIMTPDLSFGDNNLEKEYGGSLDETMIDKEAENASSLQIDAMNWEKSNPVDANHCEKTRPGVIWDVYRRQDVSKVVEYLRVHQGDFGLQPGRHDPATRPLYDGRVFLNEHHKRQLKEEYGVEPWSFEQHLGQAVFVPAGCPFQVRNLQSTVQLGLDFLSPESLGDAAKMAEDIRCLPNDHEAKLQVLEAGKISLYAASSAIKEVRKLVLDPKLGSELGFEDPNLTASVTENLEKMTKRRQISCV